MEIKPKQFNQIMASMLESSEEIVELSNASFLEKSTQRNYIQDYHYRLKQLQKINS